MSDPPAGKFGLCDTGTFYFIVERKYHAWISRSCWSWACRKRRIELWRIMPKNRNKSSPETINSKERAAKALALRKEGKTFDAIAAELGYNSKQAAHDAVMRAIREILREPVTELVQLDLERLDEMFQIHYINACAGDVQALTGCMKIMERRAKILGMDAPEKKELTGKDGQPLSGGTFVLPAVMTPEEWEAKAAEQQAQLTKGA